MTHHLMQYLDTPKPQAQAPQQGAGKYHGAVAKGYDAKRVKDEKWVCEQRIIEDMLSDLPPDSTILDCPVGTGRFIPFYQDKGFQILGMDLQEDMLREAARKADPKRARGELRIGDVRATGLEDRSVDAAVMCRLSRWLSPDDCQVALRELQRVCRKRIIWTARVANHVHARSVELFEQALDGWVITRNEAGYVLDYRILMAEPT